MTYRTYRLILGALILASLSFDLAYLMYAITATLFFEGLTGWRVPSLVRRLRGIASADVDNNVTPQSECRFNFESERGWCLMASSVLFVTYVLFLTQLWFFPWFMGFAFFGAGISGVCPMLLILQWVGFKK